MNVAQMGHIINFPLLVLRCNTEEACGGFRAETLTEALSSWRILAHWYEKAGVERSLESA